jgi:hypothetical protein
MRLVETMLCGPEDFGRQQNYLLHFAHVVTFSKRYLVSEVNIVWEHPVEIALEHPVEILELE